MLVRTPGGGSREVLRGEGGSMRLRRGGGTTRDAKRVRRGFEEEEEVVLAEVEGELQISLMPGIRRWTWGVAKRLFKGGLMARGRMGLESHF